MSDRLVIPGAARVAAGAFLTGAGLVGGVWALTSRTPMPPPPHPQTTVLWPSEDPHAEPRAETAPTSPPAPEPEPAATPAPETTPAPAEPEPSDDDPLSRGPSILPPEPESVEPEPDPLDGYDGPLVVPLSAAPGNSSPTEADDTPPARAPKPQPAPGSAVQLIHINTAGLAELQLLPGIGPVLAQRILDDRAAKGRFGSVNDLQRVKGIGEKTAAKIAPLITFD